MVLRVGAYCKTCVPSPSRSSRSTEIRLAAQLEEWANAGELPHTWTTWNRAIATIDPAQCARRRPDFVWELDDEQCVVIVEVDGDDADAEKLREILKNQLSSWSLRRVLVRDA